MSNPYPYQNEFTAYENARSGTPQPTPQPTPSSPTQAPPVPQVNWQSAFTPNGAGGYGQQPAAPPSTPAAPPPGGASSPGGIYGEILQAQKNSGAQSIENTLLNGGPFPAMGFDEGGDVPDDSGAVPDNSGGDYGQSSDSGGGQDMNAAMSTVMDTLDYGRQQAQVPSEDFSSRLESAGVKPSPNVEDNRQGQMGALPYLQTGANALAAVPGEVAGYLRERMHPSQPGDFGEQAVQGFAEGGAVGTKSYDDGGAIPDEAEDSGPEEQDASGGQDQQPQQQNPQMLMRYASGADAVSPDVAQAAEQQVDPQGQMDPNQRRVMAIANAPNQQTAWGLMQHYRQKFNVYRHAARAALDSGNAQHAVELANQALQHVPNGNSVHFAPGRGGVQVRSQTLGKPQ